MLEKQSYITAWSAVMLNIYSRESGNNSKKHPPLTKKLKLRAAYQIIFFFGLSLQFYIPNYFFANRLCFRFVFISPRGFRSIFRAAVWHCYAVQAFGYCLYNASFSGKYNRLIVNFLYGDWIVCNSQRPLLSESLNRFLGWPLSR